MLIFRISSRLYTVLYIYNRFGIDIVRSVNGSVINSPNPFFNLY